MAIDTSRRKRVQGRTGISYSTPVSDSSKSVPCSFQLHLVQYLGWAVRVSSACLKPLLAFSSESPIVFLQ